MRIQDGDVPEGTSQVARVPRSIGVKVARHSLKVSAPERYRHGLHKGIVRSGRTPVATGGLGSNPNARVNLHVA